MRLGYNHPLYLLPFDHRHSFVKGMFHASPPLTIDQRQAVIDSKRVIYDGFRQAIACGLPSVSAGILVDEEFGADIMRNATRHGYVTALSTEKSGSEEFEFEYGTAFAKHTSKRFSQPSRRRSCATTPRATRRSMSGRLLASGGFPITAVRLVRSSCSSC